jgi:hypothetical protein
MGIVDIRVFEQSPFRHGQVLKTLGGYRDQASLIGVGTITPDGGEAEIPINMANERT